MAAAEGGDRWVRISAAFALAVAAVAISAAAVSASIYRRKSRRLGSRIRELEAALAASIEKVASERRGRVRAQQALREALVQQGLDGSQSKLATAAQYPMAPIGTVHSCFSTRNGTPRQPLLAPLARACLVLEPGQVSAEALEGLADYSHCWIIYVFHLNTDLDKLWKEPSRNKFNAKVRVPRLKGGKMGVFATRSPHRPCPIGLTVAKVETVDGQAVLLSGVDLVDGTPVLDIKPYLPYSDAIPSATVPKWVKADNELAVASVHFSVDFSSSLDSCWKDVEKQSLYVSAVEFKSLIKEVLSWDIRSISQRRRPHTVFTENERNGTFVKCEDNGDTECSLALDKVASSSPSDVMYHLVLEGIDVSYKIDDSSNIMVENAALSTSMRYCCPNYVKWKYKIK